MKKKEKTRGNKKEAKFSKAKIQLIEQQSELETFQQFTTPARRKNRAF